jgi:hypothetical protein
MIELKLKVGTTLRFNLKDQTREKSLRDAWYSMEDIKQCQDKKLRIITDKSRTLLYKIGEIKDCTFIDRTFLYDTDTLQELDPGEKARIFENSVRNKTEEIKDCGENCITDIRPDLEKYKESTLPPCMEALKDGMLSFSELPECAKEQLKRTQDIMESFFNKLPNCNSDKMIRLIRGITSLNFPLRLPDKLLTNILLRALADPSDEIDKYIKEYKERREKEE